MVSVICMSCVHLITDACEANFADEIVNDPTKDVLVEFTLRSVARLATVRHWPPNTLRS